VWLFCLEKGRSGAKVRINISNRSVKYKFFAMNEVKNSSAHTAFIRLGWFSVYVFMVDAGVKGQTGFV
jgi:hypothetical protein